MNPAPQRRALVIGAGFVGSRLARAHLAQCGPVVVTTRGEEREARLRDEGLEVLRLDLGEPAAGVGAAADPVDVLYFLVPPGQLARGGSATAALDRLLPLLDAVSPRRVVIASSTVVYGDHGGAWVDAGTRPAGAGAGDRAERQLGIEYWWQRHSDALVTVRLAGLYGPDRVIGASMLRRGEAIPGFADAWLNLIHGDDAAALLVRLGTMDSPPAVALGVDDVPVRRGDYYAFLAARLGTTARFRGGDERDSRRCSNAPTVAATGWRPQFPSYREGVTAALAAETSLSGE